MQVFFFISRVGIDGVSWSKRKTAEHVTAYFHELQKNGMRVQFRDLLEGGLGWDAYSVLIDVPDVQTARGIRASVDINCKKVHRKCRPYYFRSRMLDVADIAQLNIFGLTESENKRFNEKAPPGVLRHIHV